MSPYADCAISLKVGKSQDTKLCFQDCQQFELQILIREMAAQKYRHAWNCFNFYSQSLLFKGRN